MTRHDQDVVNHRTLNAVGRQFGLIRDLRLILVEVFRQIDLRLFDELQVTCSAYSYTQRYWVVGFRLRLIQLSRDIEMSHTA